MRRRRFAGGSNGFGTQAEMAIGRPVRIRLGRVRPVDRKLLKLSFIKRVLRWQKVSDMDPVDPSAALAGALAIGTATSSTSTDTPCYTFCLNSSSLSATVDTPNPMFRLQIDNTGFPVFYAIQGTQSDGSTLNAAWQGEMQLGGSSGAIQAVRHVLNSWYDIRLVCHGCKGVPTGFDVMIVSFSATVDPYESVLTTVELQDRGAFWQHLVHKHMSSPIVPASGAVSLRKHMTVHYKRSFMLQPTLNTENDASPVSRVVRLFVKDGRIYDHRKFNMMIDGAGADDVLDNPGYYKSQFMDGANFTNYPGVGSRKYLVIRALASKRAAETNSVYTPSFDCIIRKGEYLRAGDP